MKFLKMKLKTVQMQLPIIKKRLNFIRLRLKKAKAEFNESMANMAKKTKEAFSTDFNTKPEAEAEAVEVVEAKDVEIKDSDE